MRSTKIICTIGPATATKEGVLRLAKGGMNVARINFSHGTQEDHHRILSLIRAVNDEGYSVATQLDTKGAEIRTGDLKEPLQIKKKQEVVFSPHPLLQEKRAVIHVNYDGFSTDVRETDRILLDNGELIFDIVEVRRDGCVIARAQEDGKIGSRRHINLPGADIDLPSVTEKDWEDIAFGVKEQMDFVALSFIRTAAEVEEVRAFLRKKKNSMRTIAKIETQQSVANIDAIIEAADGIMVARGDLGAEIPFELIPAIQDSIVEKCRRAHKPVIVATHMLESMIQHPMPTRAEVTDVAHAAVTRADSTMLSGETAMGKHPFAALEAMDRILREIETHLSPPAVHDYKGKPVDDYVARALGAVTMAQALSAPAIIVITRSGDTARAVSSFRPVVPVLAFTEERSVQLALQLCYGVHPHRIPLQADTEATVARALEVSKRTAKLKKGDCVVVVSNTPAKHGSISTVHIRLVP